MNLKAAAVSTLLAGLAIFFWGAAAHMLVPEPVTIISDLAAVDAFAAKHTPTNGAYADQRGFMVITSFLPDRSIMTDKLGPFLIKELITNLIQAFLMFFILSALPRTTITRYATIGAALGLLLFISTDVSYAIWYGFTTPLMMIGLLDAAIGCTLASAIIGWRLNKA
jgi:hypothetical protein